MKALTVRPPWAWAIINGGKNVENRNWQPRDLPGRIAIHAGWTVEDAIVRELVRLRTGVDELPPLATMGGVLLGTVEVVDIHTPGGAACDRHGCAPWGLANALYHWVLTNPQPCPPIPINGRLSLWTVPNREVEHLEQAMR